MSAGLEVINDDGILQIDENYRNMQLIAGNFVGGMTHYSDPSNVISYWYADIVVYGCTNPLLALGGMSNWITHGPPAFDGTTFYWRIYSHINVSFSWYVFDVPAALGNVGMEVYDASSRLKFSAFRSPMRPALPSPFIDSPLSGGAHSVAYPAGRTYAVHAMKNGVQAEGGGYLGEICTGNGAYCYQYNWMGQFYVAANVIHSNPAMHKWQDLYLSGSGFCGVYTGNQDQRLLVLDVTGAFT